MEKGRLKGEDGSGKAGRRDGKETNEVRWMGEYVETEGELNRRGQGGRDEGR